MTEREPHYAGTAREAIPEIPRHPVRLVADNIRSAYNVGSFFRTADACAIEHLYLCGMSAHPPHKKLEKTALGAFDYVPWSYHERTKDCIRAIQSEGIPVVAAEVTDDAVPMGEFDWPDQVAVVFGNEVNGINADNLRRCDHAIRIPMYGHKNSINVATAVGVVLYHILGQWPARAS